MAKELSLDDRDRILRLLGEENPDGSWALKPEHIAKRVKLHVLTVENVIRTAAVRWGKQHQWNARSYE